MPNLKTTAPALVHPQHLECAKEGAALDLPQNSFSASQRRKTIPTVSQVLKMRMAELNCDFVQNFCAAIQQRQFAELAAIGKGVPPRANRRTIMLRTETQGRIWLAAPRD